MPTNVKLKKLLHKKSWEPCTSAPVAPVAGGFISADKFRILPNSAKAFYVNGVSAIYAYEGLEDGWSQLPNSGITGTFGAGSCGNFRGLSAMGGVFTQTATGGSTTTIVTNRTIVKNLSGCRVRVIAGAGVGYDNFITSNTLGTNAVLTVPVNGTAFDATTQFQVYGGSLWFWNAGAGTVGFSVYDLATNAWTGRSVTGMPTTWATDGQLVSTLGTANSFATGQATGATGTTLSNSGKAWATNMWTNYQIRITSGVGAGQIRTIASNTGTQITVSAAWTVNPDVTSNYVIEGNDDHFYLLGNNAVTLYRFTVSSNTWATITPGAARAAAYATGGTADWIDSVPEWEGLETAPTHYTGMVRQNGRYIYSFRGGGFNILDVYDIAANTWISNVLYAGQQETFTTGTHATDLDGHIYIVKESTGRIFNFDVDLNEMFGLNNNTTQIALGGTAVVGNKFFVLPYIDGATVLNYLYSLRQSGVELVRMLRI